MGDLTEIRSTDVVRLSADEKEDLIDKLETKKYEFFKKGLNSSNREVQEILSLLSVLKKGTVENLLNTNLENRVALDRTSRTVIPLSDFNRVVDLTAPKADREPDIPTSIWRGQKDSAKDRVYRKDYDSEGVRKFQKKMQCKPMTDQMRQELSGRRNDNLVKMDVHTNKKDLIAVKTYNPLTFTGLDTI